MTNPDLVTWANDVAALLSGELPLQSLNDAANLAYAYISNVGGWVPDDLLDPNGPGMPFNGATEAQAAVDITTEQISNVYDLKFAVTVTLACQFSAHLGSGLDLNAAAAALTSGVADFVTNTINNTNLPLRVDSVGVMTADSSRSLIGGNTTAPVRLLIAADAAGTDTLVDYKAISLRYAQTTNGLNDTWNVQYIYTQPDDPVVVQIAKYTDNTYTTLDTGSTTIYVYSVSPTTYEIVTGVIINTA